MKQKKIQTKIYFKSGAANAILGDKNFYAKIIIKKNLSREHDAFGFF